MKQLLQGVLALVMTAVAGTSVAAQSVRYGLGGGLTMPVSNYSDLSSTGWHLFGKVDIGLPQSPLGVRVDGMYAQTSNNAPLLGSTKLAGGTADLVWNVPMPVPGFKPYVVAGAGVYNYNPGGGSVTKFTWGGGLGTSIGIGPIHGFGEARYLSIQASGGSLKFIPVTVGLSFGSK